MFKSVHPVILWAGIVIVGFGVIIGLFAGALYVVDAIKEIGGRDIAKAARGSPNEWNDFVAGLIDSDWDYACDVAARVDYHYGAAITLAGWERGKVGKVMVR